MPRLSRKQNTRRPTSYKSLSLGHRQVTLWHAPRTVAPRPVLRNILSRQASDFDSETMYPNLVAMARDPSFCQRSVSMPCPVQSSRVVHPVCKGPFIGPCSSSSSHALAQKSKRAAFRSSMSTQVEHSPVSNSCLVAAS